MDGFVDEEDLFDQDFGDIPANTLHELEREAITLSQRPQPHEDSHGNWRYHRPRHDHGEYHMHEPVAVDDVPPPASSDYGYDDEDVIDLDNPSIVFGANEPPITGRGAAAFQRQPFENDNVEKSNVSRPSQVGDSELAQLRARLAELEQDHVRISKALDDAQSDALTKDGAILNLRSRNERASKEFDAKLASLQKSHNEEKTKLKAEINSAKSDQRNVETSNRFLELDLAEERERMKRLKATTENGTHSAQTASRTIHVSPSKSHTHTLRDGFDEHEVTAISPTKPKDKNKRGTPKVGNKRKRDAINSPSVNGGNSPAPFQSPQNVRRDISDLEQESANLARLTIKNEHIQVIQMVLDHRYVRHGQSTLDVLTKWYLPGSNSPISSLILQALSDLSADEGFPPTVKVRGICLDFWSQCLTAKLWGPIPHVLHLLDSIFDEEPSARQVVLFERLLPLIAKTTVVVAEPRVVKATKALQKNNESSSPGRFQQAQSSEGMDSTEQIDDLQVIRLLHKIAMSASLHHEACMAFWHHTEYAFVVLMLNQAQPLSHLHLMLQIVAASTLEDSFGPWQPDPERQVKQEAGLLDLLTGLLYDVPRARDQPKPHAMIDLVGLRLEVLQTLRTISVTSHGSAALAQNRFAIGRLIRFLCDQITSLYSIPAFDALQLLDEPEDTPSANRPNNSLHSQTIASINICTRLLYHLLHDHEVDMSAKLSAVRSGYQKFLISFSRLAFSDRLLLEAGLDDEVLEAANEILDGALNPEEGAAIMQALETPRASNSGRLSLPGPADAES